VKLIIKAIDRLTRATGFAIIWLTLLMMLITCSVVVLRYGFSIGAIAMQESITYLHATVFLLGAAFTLKQGGHVRVDIFYRGFSPRRRALVDFIGGLIFLLPLCVFIGFSSWDYVLQSWSIREASPEAGGIPAVFLLKSLMPLMAATLFLQGLAETLRNLLVLINGSNTPRPQSGVSI
jgi:TRAP-type mannitol/chloroaromatic compound transport system permease small subunit